MGSGNKGISLIRAFSILPFCSSFALVITCNKGSLLGESRVSVCILQLSVDVVNLRAVSWKFSCLADLHYTTPFFNNLVHCPAWW